MKKGCLIALAVIGVLLLLLALAGVVTYNAVDRWAGLRLAPEISHESYAGADSRIRLVVKPERFMNFIEDYMPEDVELPFPGLDLKTVIRQVLPREIALLARADVIASRLRFTLFVNERRGGPLIQTLVNEENLLGRAPQVRWTSTGLEMHGRGALVAEGDIPIPSAVEAELLEIWPTRSPEPPAAVRAVHLAELVIDNRNGDILALAAAAAQAAGESWESLRAEDMADMAVNIIESIYVARLTADLQDKDTVLVGLRIDMDEKSGPGLQFLLSGLALPWLTDTLRDDFGLALAGDMRWDEAESAIIGQYTVIGIHELVHEALDEAV